MSQMQFVAPSALFPSVTAPEAFTKLRSAADTIYQHGNAYAKAYVKELIRQIIAREPPSMIAAQCRYVISNVRARNAELVTAKATLTSYANAHEQQRKF